MPSELIEWNYRIVSKQIQRKKPNAATFD